MKYSKVRGKLIEWFRYYFFFSKAALLISGLVFSHSLVAHIVVDLLMSYITDTWESASLPIAAAAVNAQQVMSAIAVIFIAHMSDAYFCHFTMILFTTKAYVLGLVLLWISDTKIWLLVVALVLISVGTAGKEPPLKEFLADQLRDHDKSQDGENEVQVEARTEVWWGFWWCLGSITATFGFSNVSWLNTFAITAAVMFAAYWLFRFGEGLPYRQRSTEEKQIEKEEASDSPLSLEDNQFFKNNSGELILMPNIPFFRWLDKAAIVEPSSLSPEQEEMQGKLCSVEQVKEIKYLLTMVPMSMTFLVYGLVEATGSTFFVEQTSNLSSPIHSNFFNIVIAFNAMKSIASFIVPYLYHFLIQRRWGDGREKQDGLLVRIGVGMVSSILCCCAAWQVELHRLSMVEMEGAKDDSDEEIHMSILWLIPQFCLWGFMKGLAEGGLVDFFRVLVSKSMKSYGEPFTYCVLSIGKLANIVCVFILRDWFGNNINNSHLDRYYLMLTILSSGNLLFYCFVSYAYKYMGGEKDAAINNKPHASLEDGDQVLGTVPHAIIGSRSFPPSSVQTTRSRSLSSSKSLQIYGVV